jgi:hypothetical protein
MLKRMRGPGSKSSCLKAKTAFYAALIDGRSNHVQNAERTMLQQFPELQVEESIRPPLELVATWRILAIFES